MAYLARPVLGRPERLSPLSMVSPSVRGNKFTSTEFCKQIPLGVVNLHHWFDRVAFPGVGDGTIDIGEGVELHEAVKGEPPRPVKIDQLGDESLGHGVALDHADGFASLNKGSGFHVAGEKRHAPLGLQYIDDKTLHLRAAGIFHDIIDAASGNFGDAGGNILTAGVDRVGGPQLQGKLEAPGEFKGEFT